MKDNELMSKTILQEIGIKPILFLFFCGLPLFSFAQEENDTIKLLQGKWELEEVSFIEMTGLKKIDVDYVDTEIFPKLEIKQDKISLFYNELNLEEKCFINDNYLSFYLYSQSITVLWKIIDDKLYLQQDLVDSIDKSKKTIVTSTYRRS